MLGFCYKDGDTYRLEVSESVVELIIKELEGYIEAMVKNFTYHGEEITTLTRFYFQEKMPW